MYSNKYLSKTQNFTACEKKEDMTSWILEKNLLPPLFWTMIIPNYFLNLIYMPTDKCSYHPHVKTKQNKIFFLQKMETIEKTTMRHNKETNGSSGAQAQLIHLYHSSYIYSSGEHHRSRIWKIERVRIPGHLLWNNIS